MIDNLKDLETSLGFKEGTLKDAIASDEAIKVEIPKGKFYDTETHVIKTNEDHEIFVGNIKKESKIAGTEMDVKDFKRDNNLEFEGKTIEGLVKAVQAKTLLDAKIEPDKKMEGYLADIEALQKSKDEYKGKYDSEVLKGEQLGIKAVNDKSVTSHMKGEFTMSTERMLNVFNLEHTLSTENGAQVVMKGGQIMKDENRSPLTLESVVTGFSKEFTKDVTGGNGGGNEGGTGGSGNLDAFNKRQKEAGNNVGSEAYMREHAAAVADSTLVL